MNQENNYHISFFKPTTARAKHNRNMVIWLVSIWAVAIFGFHFLLKAIEKPTPEPELLIFNSVWNTVKSGTANSEDIQKFAQASMHVAGKVFIEPSDRAALDNGITWATFQLADTAQKMALKKALLKFEDAAKNVKTLTDPDYLQAKNELGTMAQVILSYDPENILAKILPLELRSNKIDEFTAANKIIVETCMPKYMTHNRSVLTDTKFLGFPFHYFYTAVFLLILFIGLCWGYCYRMDKYNANIGLSE